MEKNFKERKNSSRPKTERSSKPRRSDSTEKKFKPRRSDGSSSGIKPYRKSYENDRPYERKPYSKRPAKKIDNKDRAVSKASQQKEEIKT